MIQLVEKEEDKQRLFQICDKTAFGCKIAAVAKSYGFDKSFACFWLDSELDIAYCLADGVMILSGTVMRGKESFEFLRAVGPETVICAVRNAEEMGLSAVRSGDVLKKQLPAGKEKTLPSFEVNIREIFALLEENEMVHDFEPFYLDLSHKLRHGTACVFTEHQGSGLTGCAVVFFPNEKAVLLSALAVREDCRRQGIGTRLVRRVEETFPGRTIYVFRDKEKNTEFYKKLEYVKVDTWVCSLL